MEVTHQSRSQDFSMPLHQKAKIPIEQRPTMPEVPQQKAQGSSEGPQLQKPNSYTSLRAVRQRLAAQGQSAVGLLSEFDGRSQANVDSSSRSSSNQAQFQEIAPKAQQQMLGKMSSSISENSVQKQVALPSGGGGGPNCLTILAEIMSLLFGGQTHDLGGTSISSKKSIHRGLLERWDHLKSDPHNLYQNHRTKAQAHPQYGYWDGHIQQFNNQKKGLKNRIGQWVRERCDDFGGLPQEAVNVIRQARHWITVNPPNRPDESSGLNFEIPIIPAAILTTATAIGVSRKQLWNLFWKVVVKRFALRGTIAGTLAAADGPFPVGDLLALGMGVWTVGEIVFNWDSLWGEVAGEI